jgi:hypothetical protein
MCDLADVYFPEAELIRVVLDNLSTHSGGALYQAFPADEATRVLRRLEFHYVPKHASWLNMVEIEIGGWLPNASIAASKASSNWPPKSPPGSASAMWPAPASNGCSHPIRLAPKCVAPIRSLRPSQARCNESKPLCRATSLFSSPSVDSSPIYASKSPPFADGTTGDGTRKSESVNAFRIVTHSPAIAA